MKLKPKHLEDLGKSGLNKRDAKALCITSLKTGDAYAIPFYDINSFATDYVRYRNFGDGPKYTQSRNTSPRLYFPTIGGIHWPKVAKNTATRILICEGEKKSAAACKAGMACIGITGKDCWQSNGTPLADWRLITWTDRVVELVPDSDQSVNDDVRRSFLQLGDFLASLGAKVFIRELPTLSGQEKTGLDDFLAAHE